MADPIVGAAVIGLGTGLNALGQLEQGQAQQDAAEFNAQIAEQNANEVTKFYGEEERRFRIIARKQLGSARVALGASGIRAEGSPLDVLEESAANAEMEAQSIRYEGEVKRRDYLQQAQAERLRGRAAVRSSRYGAASSLLLGAADIFSGFGGAKSA